MKEREFKKEYKNFFNSIYISNDKKKIIMDNIIDNKKKKVFFLKPSMAILMLFMTIFLGITVYAAVNSELFNTLVVKYKERKDGEKDVELSSSAIKEINYQADVSKFDKNGKYKIYSTSEIEKLLGIKILKSGIFKNQNMYINAMEKDKNNNIGYIGINYQETASSNNNFIVGWFKVHITTKYAESKNVNENVNMNYLNSNYSYQFNQYMNSLTNSYSSSQLYNQHNQFNQQIHSINNQNNTNYQINQMNQINYFNSMNQNQ